MNNHEVTKQGNQRLVDWHFKVTIKEGDKFQVASNQRFIVMVSGQLREYSVLTSQEPSAEVLLRLISDNNDDYYQYIAGFFSAIIFDKSQSTITLVSDHIGSKPLYYNLLEQVLVISDNLDNLDVSTLTLNPQGIFNYCFFHCIAAPTTIYKEVFKLEPGQSVTINNDCTVVSSLLYQPNYQYHEAPSEESYQHCRRLIAQAVSRHASDGCGAFLSGGLDSSTVAGMLAKQIHPAKTFSIGFDSAQYDESAYAKLTATHFATQHHSHVMQPDELVDHFKQIASHFDQPFGNSSAMAAYGCAMFAKEHGVTTLLAGDGGDEIFAGNERYAQQAVFNHFNQAPRVVQHMLEGVFCNAPMANIPLVRKAASYIQQAKTPLPDRLDSYNFLNRFDHQQIFTVNFLSTVEPCQPVLQKRQRFEQANSDSELEKMLFLDWKFTLADNDLVKVSKMCEMAGVDVCYPLLEKELVDFSCQINAQDKLKGNELRYFFKQAMTGFLPSETLSKEKHGFGLPFGLWMKESDELMGMAQTALTNMSKRDIFNPQFLELAVEMHQSEHASYYGELIWLVVVLEIWLDSRGL